MENMRFWYPASIAQITEINDSFDSCMLRVCYAGENRNKSIIPKEAIEAAIPTMAYCPLVANYDVESDTIGGHDVAFINTDDGLKMVNLTDAVGVVPADPQWTWETVVEDDGTEHEYLTTPAILWKRTPVYSKLKKDGVSGQSMEIRVREGKLNDGMFEVQSFDFTAFCLLGEGVEPCFESAQVEMFSTDKLSMRLGEMMEDFKKQFSVIAASADDNKTPNGDDFSMKGGEGSLNINELLQKYGLTMEDINFEIGEDMSAEEIEAKFAELAKKFADDDPAESGDSTEGDPDAGDDANDDDGNDDDDDSGDDSSEDDTPAEDDNDDAPGGTKPKKEFALTGEQLGSGIRDALRSVTYTDEWGEWGRYGYVDYDAQAGEVYAYDYIDWNLYGFSFSMNGDNVVIDFDSKKRKKFAFVDFDMGEAQFDYKSIVASANERFEALTNEVKQLREYKHNIEAAERKAQEDEVFAKFPDLVDNAQFAALRENCANMSIEDIEDKCFAIRGRNVQMKFSQDTTKPVRLPVEHNIKNADEPYGGVFLEFGIGK